ncbi:protein-disulfide reductase DsbD family protein [Corticibacter populi]|nr:protein-disulfide reductase DsbD domain-containing protein [Corticibacter populi]RZS30837.1 thiol:disulfide interchange protein DsbD [Corticibacter populi]
MGRLSTWLQRQAALLCAVLLAAWACGAAAQIRFSTDASGAPAASAQVQTPHVRAELVVHAPEGLQPGEPVWLGLLIEHAPGWHTYWKNPGDSGMATELQWQLPPGLEAGAIDWPTPRKLRIGTLANYGYEGTVLLPVPVTVAPGGVQVGEALGLGRGAAVPITLHASWLVCKLECIPEQGSFHIQVPVQGTTGLHAAGFQQAWQQRPEALAAEGSSAAAEGDRLRLRIAGLPAALQGHKLELFAETPFTLAHGARDGQEWQQHWEEGADAAAGVWIAEVPLAPDREASGASLPLVLTRMTAEEGGDWHPAGGELTQGWRVQVPVTAGWQGAARAQPSAALLQALADNQARADAGAAVATGTPVTVGWSTASAGSTVQWAWMLVLALLGGAALNLMPCVFPVLAIKALSIVRHGGDRRLQRRSALAYGAGVVVSFALLGALMLALRLAGTQLGWGFQLQSPWFVAGMALLFTLMGLALAGVFELRVWLPSALGDARPRSPLVHAALSGVLAVLIASPCTGPFMGAALGATLGLPAWAALGIFLALGLGMALPFVALVWFPDWLARLPRPGAWMEGFQRAMAFPMFATVAWLLWVLAQQVGIDGMAAWLFVLWALSFALWLWGHRPRSAALVLKGAWALVLLAPLAVLALGALRFAAATAAPPAAPQLSQAETGAGWQEWSPEVQQQALDQGLPVFVDFTASWCITCQYNKATTLADEGVLADFAAAGVRLLRADWTRQNPAITEALRALGRSGVPTYALHVPGRPVVVMAELLDRAELRTQLQALPPR